MLDKIVNQCEDLVNLREVILLHRLKYSTTGNITHLQSASACLERYFFLIAFSSYVNEWETVHQTGGKSEFKIISFRSWLSNRTEIWRMLERFRKQGHKLVLFRPVEDLSVFSENQGEKDAQIINGHVQIAPEIENFIVKSRHGTVLSARTILKVDFWGDVQNASFKINGASNFRKIPGFPVYGVAQPTMNGIRNSLQFLGQEHSSKILWINLREEPLIYINGTPYVLRDNYLTLRNLNSYSGITSQRLEMIESRLKEDVLAELAIHENKIMIHAEEKSKTHAVWAECNADSSVMTTSEIMNSLKLDSATTLCYFRVVFFLFI